MGHIDTVGATHHADIRRVVAMTLCLCSTSLGLTTVFGNPGSTEQTFLKNFPDDFPYILGLQEASVLAMADGFARSTGKPPLVNLHTSAGAPGLTHFRRKPAEVAA